MVKNVTDIVLRRDIPGRRALRREPFAFVSPDIIPVGPVPTPSSQSALITDFDLDVAQPYVLNVVNQIYVRGTNNTPQDSGFGASLFVAPSPSLIPWPDLFLSNQIPTQRGVLVNPLPPTATGGRYVSDDPFCLSTNSHAVSLFAAVMSSSSHSSHSLLPDEPVETAEALIDYYQTRRNVAVRNTVIVPITGRSTFAYGYGLAVRNIMQELEFLVEARSVSAGWSIGLSYLPDGGDKPQVLIKPTVVQDPNLSLIDCRFDPKVNPKGMIIVTIETNGVAATPGWSVDVTACLVVSSNHNRFKAGLSHDELLLHRTGPGLLAGETRSSLRSLPVGGFSVAAQQCALS